MTRSELPTHLLKTITDHIKVSEGDDEDLDVSRLNLKRKYRNYREQSHSLVPLGVEKSSDMLLEEARRQSSQGANQRHLSHKKQRGVSLGGRSSSIPSKQSLFEKARDVVLINRGRQNDSLSSLHSYEKPDLLTIDYQPYDDKSSGKPLKKSSSFANDSRLAAVRHTYGSQSTKSKLPPLKQRATSDDIILEDMDETMTGFRQQKQMTSL